MRSMPRFGAASRSHAPTKPAVMPYVREHAVEMSDDVMRAHIELYVNEFTDDLGETGRDAVHALFARARDAGISQSGDGATLP